MNDFKRNIISAAVLCTFHSISGAQVNAAGCIINVQSNNFYIKNNGSSSCDLSAIPNTDVDAVDGYAQGHVNNSAGITQSFVDFGGIYGKFASELIEDKAGSGYLSIFGATEAGSLIDFTGNRLSNISSSGDTLIVKEYAPSTGKSTVLNIVDATFNQDLMIYHESKALESSNIYSNGGVIKIEGNFSSVMKSPSTVVADGSKFYANTYINTGSLMISADAYIYNLNGSRGIQIGAGSVHIGGDLLVVMDRDNNSADTQIDNTAGLIIDGLLRIDNPNFTADNVKIITKNTTGLVMRSGVAKATSLHIDTTVPDGTAGVLSSPGNGIDVIFGTNGGAFSEAKIISNNYAINFQSTGSGGAFNLYLGIDSVDINKDIIESNKFGPNYERYGNLYLGGRSYLESKLSDTIFVVDQGSNYYFNLNVERGAEIISPTGKYLLNSRAKNNIININDGAMLYGDINLDDGNDIFNFRGSKFEGNIFMRGGDDVVNLFSGNSNYFETIDAGAGTNDLLNIYNTTNGYTENINGMVSSSSPGIDTPSFLNFNIINIKNGGTLNLTGSDIKADNFIIEAGGEISLDPSIQTGSSSPNISSSTIHGNVINSGFINLDVNASNIGQKLTINGDYTGNDGVLEIDTRWVSASNTGTTSITDELIITGNAYGRTRVSVLNGIAGDVTLADNPVIPVPEIIILGNISPGAFWGYAETINAGEAQLALNAQTKEYYWTLKNSDGGEIYSPDIPGYVLVPYVNMELMRDSVSTYRDRVGGEYNKAYDYGQSKDRRTWWRIWHKHMHGNGAQRLDWKSNNSGYQVGYQLENRTEKGHSIRTDGYISYLRAASNAYDQMTSESSSIMENKYAGNMHAHNINLGLTRTYINNDYSYKDIVLQLSTVKNHYQGRRGGNAENRAWGFTISFEQGKQINISDSWYIEPMYQVMANYLSLDNFNDGVRNVSQGKHWDGLFRTGGRLYFKDPVNEAQNNLVYMKAHYVQDFGDNGKATIGRSTITEKNAKQWVEFGLGFQVNGSKNTHFFFDASMDRNLGGAYRDSYQVQFGITHKW